MRRQPDYVKRIVRKKDEALLTGLHFLTELRNGEGTENKRTEAACKLSKALDPEAASLANNRADYGGNPAAR